MKKNLILVLFAVALSFVSCKKEDNLPNYDILVKVELGSINYTILNRTHTLTQGQRYGFYFGDFPDVKLSCRGTCIYSVNGVQYTTPQTFKLR